MIKGGLYVLLGDSGKKWQTCYHIGVFFATDDEPIDQKSSKKANLQKLPAIPLVIWAGRQWQKSGKVRLVLGVFLLVFSCFSGMKKGS